MISTICLKYIHINQNFISDDTDHLFFVFVHLWQCVITALLIVIADSAVQASTRTLLAMIGKQCECV